MPVEPEGPAVRNSLTFDGRQIPVLDGQTIGASLTAAGVRSWRTTRGSRAPRGLFCGIGVCYDCLLRLNGRPNVRACVTAARPGDIVTTQEGTGYEHLDV